MGTPTPHLISLISGSVWNIKLCSSLTNSLSRFLQQILPAGWSLCLEHILKQSTCWPNSFSSFTAQVRCHFLGATFLPLNVLTAPSALCGHHLRNSRLYSSFCENKHHHWELPDKKQSPGRFEFQINNKFFLNTIMSPTIFLYAKSGNHSMIFFGS